MQNTGQVQKWVQRNGSVTIPKGGSFRLMVDLAPKKRGVSIVEMTTLLIFDKEGNLFRQCNKTRPRAQARIRRRTMELPVRRCVLCTFPAQRTLSAPALNKVVPAPATAAQNTVSTDDRPPMAWARFLSSIGVSTQTGWRWRKLGLIQTHAIAGKPYVSAVEIESFNQRLAAGEFSGIRKTGAVRAASKGRSTK